MNKISLKEDTIESIKRFDHTLEDVAYVNIPYYEVNIHDFKEYFITLTQFLNVISDRCYDADFGLTEINPHIKIVFKDRSYMTRNSFGGREWWHYNSVPNLDVEMFNGDESELKDVPIFIEDIKYDRCWC